MSRVLALALVVSLSGVLPVAAEPLRISPQVFDQITIPPVPGAVPPTSSTPAPHAAHEAAVLRESARRLKSWGLSTAALGFGFQVLGATAWATDTAYCSGGSGFATCTSFKTADPVSSMMGLSALVVGTVLYVAGRKKEARANKLAPVTSPETSPARSR